MRRRSTVFRCALAGTILIPAWIETPVPTHSGSLSMFADPIAAACPDTPELNLPGILCEGFERSRNGVPGIQWSRLPLVAHPTDPLRAIGDPNDDILGFTLHGGATPHGTDAATCRYDLGFPDCQDAVSEENDWHLHSPFEGPGAGYDSRPGIGAPDGGKAHQGFRSMHMGRHTNVATTLGDAIRFRQVSAFVLDSQTDPDLPGIVPGPASTLEFWHMISVPDDENFGSGFVLPGTSFGGGQVQISLLGADGNFGRWLRLIPTFNGYDSTVDGDISLCSFDPGDDSVSPVDESFCGDSGGPVWADFGDIHGADPDCLIDTDGNDPLHRDCGALSDCAGGPGCAETGSLGTGVWARSAFDLSPFAGRVARLRWIGMVEGGWSFGESRSASEPESIEYQMNDGDDGWYVDDIVLTDLRRAPADCDQDLDGDGVVNCNDCHTTDPDVWEGPGEATDMRFASDGRTISWSAPAVTGSTAPRYDVIRSRMRGRFMSTADPNTVVCVVSDGAATTATDPEDPPLNRAFYYLVRAENGCPSVGSGPLGSTSSGSPLVARTCP